MTRDDIAALRASACAIVGTLGSLLDSLQLADEILANPGDAFSDTVISAQHIDEAAGTADTLAQHANDFATAIDRLAVARKAAAEAMQGGAT